MTNLQKYHTEQIVHHLNKLHEDNMFTMTWRNIYDDENKWAVTIETKNTAYRNELYMLEMLLDAMKPLIDNRAIEIEIK